MVNQPNAVSNYYYFCLYSVRIGLSTVEVVAIVGSPVVAVALILLLSTVLLVCGLRRRHVKRKGIMHIPVSVVFTCMPISEAQSCREDYIMTSDNPVYASAVASRQAQKIDLYENNAYDVIK